MAEVLLTESTERHEGYALFLDKACKVLAVISGVILTLMALMSIRSIVGRTFFESPLLGDYELVQMMCAVAVALALPYTHWVKANVIVDFFTAHTSEKTNAGLDTLANLFLAIFSAVIAWRLLVGLFDLRSAEDASMLLGIPTWWSYSAMVPSFALLSLTALYAAVANLRKFQK
ncbi:MAG: hypothetical protein RLZZ591_2367 [Pseudomonadota bacterium]